MSVLDVFGPNAFTLQSLIAAINHQDLYTPTTLGDLKLYSEAGTPNLTVLTEEINRLVGLVTVKPRGSDGQVVNGEKAKVYPWTVPHLPERATIMADSVQGVREFGSESNARTIESVRDQRLQKMRRQIDYTIEYHRLLALQGNYINVNGDATSLFTTYGTTQQSIDFVLGTTGTKVKGKCLDVQYALEGELGGVANYDHIHVLCGNTFWKELINHPEVEKYLLNTPFARELSTNLLGTFDFGDMRFQRYRGNGTVGIAATEAYAFPVGVPDMFISRFAPADYSETVNTMGLPYYAKAEEMKFGKGVEIEAQSNPLNINTRPSAVIKLTTSN